MTAPPCAARRPAGTVVFDQLVFIKLLTQGSINEGIISLWRALWLLWTDQAHFWPDPQGRAKNDSGRSI